MKEKLVEVFVYTRNKTTQDGRKFKTYSTKANFYLTDEYGKITTEKAPHYITLKFAKDAFDGSNVKLSDIKRGKLLVDGKCITLPLIYEVTTDKDGKKVYPVCWISGGIDSFTPVEKEHEFDFIVEEDKTEIEEE